MDGVTALTPGAVEETSKWLRSLGGQIRAPEFRNWSQGFMADHCDAFALAEENSHESWNAHQVYQREAELRLEAAGKRSGVPIDVLLERLPAYMARHSVQADEAASEALDLLTSLTDFDAFKASMLVAKKDKLTATATEDVMEASALGAAAVGDALEDVVRCAGETEGWVTLSRRPWIVIERHVPKADGSPTRDVLVRTTMTLDLPFASMKHMILTYSNEVRVSPSGRGGGGRRSDPAPAV